MGDRSDSGLSLLCVSLSVLIRRREIDTASPTPSLPRSLSPPSAQMKPTRTQAVCVSNNESPLARVTPADNQFTGQERGCRRRHHPGECEPRPEVLQASSKAPIVYQYLGRFVCFPRVVFCCKITRMNLCMDRRISRHKWVPSDI